MSLTFYGNFSNRFFILSFNFLFIRFIQHKNISKIKPNINLLFVEFFNIVYNYHVIKGEFYGLGRHLGINQKLFY